MTRSVAEPRSQKRRWIDSATRELREMKMQPSLERVLRHRGLLNGSLPWKGMERTAGAEPAKRPLHQLHGVEESRS